MQILTVEANDGMYDYKATIFEPHDHHFADIFLLHGAGNADAKRMFPLCIGLGHLGFRCIAFDFHGHGTSGVSLSNSSLALRRRQAVDAIGKLKSDKKSVLVAFSMSGQTAIEAAMEVDVCRLILFAPAMYTKAATDIGFGPLFSEQIRKPESWRDSNVTEALQVLDAHVNVFVGELDTVIPRDISIMYSTTQQSDYDRTLTFLKDEGHMLSGRTNDDPVFCQRIVELIARLIKVDL